MGGRGEKEMEGGVFKVSGTDYPWKAINLPRDLDNGGVGVGGQCTHTHTQKHTPRDHPS